jgi:phospholipase/carboxylesterase
MAAPADRPPPTWLGPDLAHASAVTVLLHGRARSAGEMLEIARRVDLPRMTYVALAAPGATWYPESFLAPVSSNQPFLDGALAQLDDTVEAIVRAGPSRSRIACVGFSQGACLAAEYVFRRAGLWGGLAALTGGLIGPPESRWGLSARLHGTPILLATAEEDAWVPLWRVRQTAEVFRAMGAEVDVRIYPGAAHEISDDAVDATRRMLARLLPA